MKTRSSRTPSQKKRPAIGYFNMTMTGDWALRPWLGIADAARKRDVNLVTFIGGVVGIDQANVLYDLARGGRLDGLIIWNAGLVQKLEAEVEAFCNQYGIPIVTLEGRLAEFPCVTYENYMGLRRLTEHLIQAHGYQKIGFLGMLEHHEGFRERYRGYADAMEAHGLPVDPTLARPWFPLEQLAFGLVEAHTLNDYIDNAMALGMEAVICIADDIAYQVLDELEKRDIGMPKQVAVVGFDDNLESRMTTPPLTTIKAPFYEMGYTAAETLIDLLAGESVPELVNVPAALMVRQSCGCRDAYVTAAAMPDHPPATKASLDLPEIVAELVTTAQTNNLETALDELQPLLESFVTELTTANTGVFLDTLEQALQRSIASIDELSRWHNIIATLRQQILPQLNRTGSELQHAETLLQQAQILISRIAERMQMSRSFQATLQENLLRNLGLSLITTLDVDALMNILAEGLPGLNIPSCYLSLFETTQSYRYPDPAPEYARLILAYNANGRIDLEPGGQRFPSPQLIPTNLCPQKWACSFVMISLHFQEAQMGFVMFESGSRNGQMYETLGAQISSALQGALLVQRVQDNAAEIARQKYVLDSFMDNVPDTIYFKDRDSRITQVNRAFVHRFGLVHPAQIVGKTDFDLFSEEEAHSKYEQEQGIIRTGRPVLDLEEPDIGGRWALTTKMPLRDENNEIIGTFGVSRDITELKQVQQALEVANKEISSLNEQLKEENLRMSAELNVARRLQEMILPPPEELQQIEGLDIVGFMQPAAEVGGDYYDVLHKNGTTHIGIGDVTGHGLESGVLMLMTQTAIRTLIDHGETDPVKLVTTLNRTIYNNVRRTKMDKSLTFALVNCQGGQLKIVGQHEEMLVVKADGQVERVKTLELGITLGLIEEIAQWVDQTMVKLKPGEGIVLYTDGITEATNDQDELYGLERLCEVISQNWPAASAEDVKQAVVDDVIRHIGQQIIYDDLTLVVLKQQ